MIRRTTHDKLLLYVLQHRVRLGFVEFKISMTIVWVRVCPYHFKSIFPSAHGVSWLIDGKFREVAARIDDF